MKPRDAQLYTFECPSKVKNHSFSSKNSPKKCPLSGGFKNEVNWLISPKFKKIDVS
jgi:hypothetical protein